MLDDMFQIGDETYREYHLHHGDCITHMAELPDSCFDFAVFSPPFPSLFAYTSEEADVGNSENVQHESKLHLSFFYHQLARVLKPGRAAVVHVMQIPALKRNEIEGGIFDFRGLNIRLGRREGLVYDYDWIVSKNPQAQAIRTHSHRLLFVTLERDRSVSTGALGDYLIKFRKPGENAVPIDSPEITRNEWIDWAECCWNDINETRTLNIKEGRGEDDTKHICPLQLDTIDRLIRLFSNPGEIVFSPFAGIGSEGHEALRLDRRFYGCELKKEYYEAACKNLERGLAKRDGGQGSLFAQEELLKCR
jgi:DNA modification methylase